MSSRSFSKVSTIPLYSTYFVPPSTLYSRIGLRPWGAFCCFGALALPTSSAEGAVVPRADDAADRAGASGAPATGCAEAPVLLVGLASLPPAPQPAAAKASAIVIDVVIVRYVIACDSLRLTT